MKLYSVFVCDRSHEQEKFLFSIGVHYALIRNTICVKSAFRFESSHLFVSSLNFAEVHSSRGHANGLSDSVLERSRLFDCCCHLTNVCCEVSSNTP